MFGSTLPHATSDDSNSMSFSAGVLARDKTFFISSGRLFTSMFSTMWRLACSSGVCNFSFIVLRVLMLNNHFRGLPLYNRRESRLIRFIFNFSANMPTFLRFLQIFCQKSEFFCKYIPEIEGFANFLPKNVYFSFLVCYNSVRSECC